MALTLEQLRSYEECGGDIDGWSRSRHAENNPSSGENWDLIDDLLMRLAITADGRASASFASRLEQDIAAAAPDPTVREALLALSRAGRGSARP